MPCQCVAESPRQCPCACVSWFTEQPWKWVWCCAGCDREPRGDRMGATKGGAGPGQGAEWQPLPLQSRVRRPCKASDKAGHSLRTKGLRTIQRTGSWVQAQPRGSGERQQGLAHRKVWSQPVAKSSMHPFPTISQLLGSYSAPAQAVDTQSLA